jgi:hypothetical protein
MSQNLIDEVDLSVNESLAAILLCILETEKKGRTAKELADRFPESAHITYTEVLWTCRVLEYKGVLTTVHSKKNGSEVPKFLLKEAATD